MKKDQLAEATIKATGRKLRHLAKSCNLDIPEDVKEYLANKKGKNGYIESLVDTYNRYVIYNGLTWKKPRIKRTSQPPYVPTTEEISILIADAGKKYALIFSMFRDGGFRPIEMERMTLRWIDLNRGKVNVETAKHGLGRTIKLKESTAAMLKEYVIKNNFRLDDRLFPRTKTMQRMMCHARRSSATKLKRPELEKISLYSFRHYFASMLYHKTRDYLHVKKQLGHRRIEQTITYIHQIYDSYEDNDFTTATATTVKEARQLLENGFDYKLEIDGVKIFRKRK